MATKEAEPTIEVKARLPKSVHDKLLVECHEIGCHVNGYIRAAIVERIVRTRGNRSAAASYALGIVTNNQALDKGE